MTRIALLMTGSEIMAGDIIDTNAPFIAQQLTSIGFRINEKVSVGDDINSLNTSISRLTQENQVLIINGGLGPTSDDLTALVLSQVSGYPLEENAQARQHIEQWCIERQFEINPSQLKQCLLPSTASIFNDSPGSACGFSLQVGQCLVIATPGVPSELKAITSNAITPLLTQCFQLEQQAPWQRFQLFGIGETSIQALIDSHAPKLSQYFEVGYRAQLTQVELKLRRLPSEPSLSNDAMAQQDADAASAKASCLDAIDHFIFGEGSCNLATALSEALNDKSQTLGLAESCTGGLIAQQITALEGASQYFNGGIVSYSNEVKRSILGVKASTLEQYGAVSEKTALEMLDGCLKQCACDVALSITGIAGPGGGSAEKPVGTVYIAYGSRQQQHCLALCVPFERSSFQALCCAIALDSLRRFVLQLPLNKGFTERYKIKTQ
ncbi:MAG: CinA family nicotinamide mononucleotide deamidase-related protein [Sinobacterium sp.]|nr:CinA family nicotinamide mononucleotide deamidase-related protein [Sinobacterium sp.]